MKIAMKVSEKYQDY